MDYSRQGNKKNKRKGNPHTKRVKNKIGVVVLRLFLSVILIGGFAIVGGVWGIYLGILADSPSLENILEGLGAPEYRTTVIVNQRGEELTRLHGGQNHVSVPLEQIPMHVRHAFVAIEDERFFEHFGIDVRAIGRAVHMLLTTDSGAQGASTITQQLIKNMLNRFESDLTTKLQEQYLAVNFERMLTEALGCRYMAKDLILESYLNIISLGRTSIGVQAAAWFYYGVDVSELTIAQGATIAAITQNPSRFPPDVRPYDNWQRTQLVLNSMLRLGFITEEEHAIAMEVDSETGLGVVYNTIFRVEGGGTRPLVSEFDCFTDALIEQVATDLAVAFNLTREQAMNRIYTTGLRIVSTQDDHLQRIVDNAFLNDALWPGPDSGFAILVEYYLTVFNTITESRRHYRHSATVNNMDAAHAFIQQVQHDRMTTHDRIESDRSFFLPQPQGAFLLMDHHTGHIVAMRGIRGEKEGNMMFNRATQAMRHPGSQLKPLVPFGVGFELGIMQPATVFDDIPFTFISPGSPPWTPGNWWGSTFEGLSTARRAIYRSQNVVSARAAVDNSIAHVGLPSIMAFLENLGISTLTDTDGAAVVLGGMTRGVKLYELAGAYAAVANMGEFNAPVLYTRVYDHLGNILLENPHQPRRVMRETTAYLLIDTMRDTLTRGTGNRVRDAVNDTRQNIDFAGKTGTSERNTDLGFVGFSPYFTAAIWMGNDLHTGMHRNSNQFHTPLWGHIMNEIHLTLPPRRFEQPLGITTVTVCLDSGHRATDLCRTDPRGNRTRNEVFASIHAPGLDEYCTVHQSHLVCTVTGHLASEHCPPETTVTRVGIVRPFPIDHITETVSDRVHEIPFDVRAGHVCEFHTAPAHGFDEEEEETDPWSGWFFPPAGGSNVDG